MRPWLTLLCLAMLAGCVDPQARIEAGDPPPDGPPVDGPSAQIVVTPQFDLENEQGQWERDILLGETVVINATSTPTHDLTELVYSWVEEGDMVHSGTLWPGPGRKAIQPTSEGTHAITVASRSTTGTWAFSVLHLGVSVQEERSYDLAPAHPLSDPASCQPAHSLIGDEASTVEEFVVHAAALQESAVFRATAGAGVRLAWCDADGQPVESLHEQGWTTVVLPLDGPSRTIGLWIANTSSEPVSVEIERLYPGTPTH